MHLDEAFADSAGQRGGGGCNHQMGSESTSRSALGRSCRRLCARGRRRAGSCRGAQAAAFRLASTEVLQNQQMKLLSIKRRSS